MIVQAEQDGLWNNVTHLFWVVFQPDSVLTKLDLCELFSCLLLVL